MALLHRDAILRGMGCMLTGESSVELLQGFHRSRRDLAVVNQSCRGDLVVVRGIPFIVSGLIGKSRLLRERCAVQVCLLTVELSLLLMVQRLLVVCLRVVMMQLGMLAMGMSHVVLTWIHLQSLPLMRVLWQVFALSKCVQLDGEHASRGCGSSVCKPAGEGTLPGRASVLSEKGGPSMEKPFVEIPQVDIPDEVTQVDLPEIVETTPHPQPTSPQASVTAESGNDSRPIGFTP